MEFSVFFIIHYLSRQIFEDKKNFMMSAYPLIKNQGASDELDSEVAFQHHNTLKVIIYKVMVEDCPPKFSIFY